MTMRLAAPVATPDGDRSAPSLAGLHWLVETDVTTLMRLGNCSRYDVVQAQKAARAQLKMAELLECHARTQRLRAAAA
jgi:hypothetical protein